MVVVVVVVFVVVVTVVVVEAVVVVAHNPLPGLQSGTSSFVGQGVPVPVAGLVMSRVLPARLSQDAVHALTVNSQSYINVVDVTVVVVEVVVVVRVVVLQNKAFQ